MFHFDFQNFYIENPKTDAIMKYKPKKIPSKPKKEFYIELNLTKAEFEKKRKEIESELAKIVKIDPYFFKCRPQRKGPKLLSLAVPVTRKYKKQKIEKKLR